MTHRWIVGIVHAVFFAAFSAAASGQSSLQPGLLSELAFHQHPGAALPLEARFVDDTGRSVRLGQFFHGEPVVLVLEYLRCRDLCSYVLRDTAAALQRMPLIPGRDFEVIALSIDAREGPADSRAARAMDLPRGRSAGWHFLTGGQPEIRAVAQAVGFPYRYDPAIDQFAHPAGIVVATPAGTVARYLLGLAYRPLDLRLALAEAGRGHIASPVADLLLLCYCYDPGTGRYSFAIRNATRALCGATLLGLGAMLFGLARPRRT
ncbi:MAG: SCO family protein [Steroidobacteraceae bacterium]